MNKAKVRKQAAAIFIAFATLFVHAGNKSNVYAASVTPQVVLNQEMQNEEVLKLQGTLKVLNLFSVGGTGYFGNINKISETKLYEGVGQEVENIVVLPQPTSLLQQQLQRPARTLSVSRGEIVRQNVLLPWFNNAENIFALGTVAEVTDIDTGISFMVERTGGANHADTETLSVKDTALLKKVYGGQWNWERRAVIITIGKQKIAGSMTGMPHAGRDDKPARDLVVGRSGGYGTGINYDSIKGNGMEGHFDIHFLGSRTHTTNRVDEQHQAMIQKAAQYLMK